MVDIMILITDKSWKNLSHHENQSSITTEAISTTTVAILLSSCVHLHCKTGPMQANSCEEPCARQYPNHHYSFLPPLGSSGPADKIISMDRACLKLKLTQDKNMSSWKWQLLACCT